MAPVDWITRLGLVNSHLVREEDGLTHVGSLDALKERLPNAEVIVSTRDARLRAKDMSLDADERATSSGGGYPGARTKSDRTVDPGDRVGSLEVIAAPGHTLRSRRVPRPPGPHAVLR